MLLKSAQLSNIHRELFTQNSHVRTQTYGYELALACWTHKYHVSCLFIKLMCVRKLFFQFLSLFLSCPVVVALLVIFGQTLYRRGAWREEEDRFRSANRLDWRKMNKDFA